jgi:phage terminase Nu1 subunit (DNA packaging protein)
MTESISKTQLARHLGVVPSRITALIKRGLPVLANGKIDLAQASEWMKANCEASVKFRDRGVNKMLEADIGHEPAEAAQLDDDAAVLDYPTARALRETFLARMARLEFLAKSGKLLDADEVQSVWTTYLGDCRKRLLCVASQCGTRLSLSRAEIDVIDREIRDALMELAGEQT